MASDGGPAFPQSIFHDETPSDDSFVETKGGMSLRDYFAGQALNGMLASDSSVDRTKVNKSVWANVAYDFAAAMLKAREAQP